VCGVSGKWFSSAGSINTQQPRRQSQETHAEPGGAHTQSVFFKRVAGHRGSCWTQTMGAERTAIVWRTEARTPGSLSAPLGVVQAQPPEHQDQGGRMSCTFSSVCWSWSLLLKKGSDLETSWKLQSLDQGFKLWDTSTGGHRGTDMRQRQCEVTVTDVSWTWVKLQQWDEDPVKHWESNHHSLFYTRLNTMMSLQCKAPEEKRLQNFIQNPPDFKFPLVSQWSSDAVWTSWFPADRSWTQLTTAAAGETGPPAHSHYTSC